jgi:hypothetical protein
MSGTPLGAVARAPGVTAGPVSHRQLAELQRTLTTKATQLEQLSIDITRLLDGAGDGTVPWAALLDERLRRAWHLHHRDGLHRLIADLEDQARQLSDLRRHLLPAAGEVDRGPVHRDER